MAILGLRELQKKYEELASSSSEPVALEAFGLSDRETEMLFTSLDEDYQISRFLRFEEREGKRYLIGGAPATHVTIEAGITD